MVASAAAPAAAAAAVAVLKANMKGIGAALVAAACGLGMKAEQQADALKVAVGVVEALKRLQPGAKLGEVLGPERINAVAKAVATVRVRRAGRAATGLRACVRGARACPAARARAPAPCSPRVPRPVRGWPAHAPITRRLRRPHTARALPARPPHL